MDKSPPKTDVLLEPLLLAANQEEVDACLAQLITTHLAPIVKGVIRYKLHFNPYHAAEQAEADDLQQEVTLQLLAELQKFCKQPGEHSIGDVRALAAVIAHRACARWLRRQFPARHAFKNRLYYLLTRQRGFGLWQNENRKLMAGFAVWQGRNRAATDRLKSISDNQKLLAQIMSLQTGGQLAGASGYVVEVYDEAFNPVATSPQLTANSWTSPPLKRDHIYSWQVKAVKDGQEFTSPRPPAPQAKFRVLDAATVNELKQARRAYGSSHLVLGLLYARAGLLDEAEKEFRTLQKANPDSEVARRLVGQVRNLRR